MKAILNVSEAAVRAVVEVFSPLRWARLIQVNEPVEGRPDVEILFELFGEQWQFHVEMLPDGQPRAVRQSAGRLRRFNSDVHKSYGIVVAPFVTDRSREICNSQGVGYVDLGGNCLLSFGSVHISCEGRPNKFINRRQLLSVFRPKATRVLRVLLSTHPRQWKLHDLAAEAHVSLGHVFNVKTALLDREQARMEKKLLVLSQPQAVLDDWAGQYSFRSNRSVDCYSLDDIGTLEARLGELADKDGLKVALTGFSAAASMAFMVKYQRVMVYVSDPEQAASLLGLKKVDSGANVTLLTPYDEGVFYGVARANGLPVVSPVQAYLDLVTFRGRGEEAAKEILDKVIVPQWQNPPMK